MAAWATTTSFFSPRTSASTRLDALLAAAVLVGAAALASVGGLDGLHPAPGALDLVGLGAVALSALPLVAWRRWPAGVFLLTAAGAVLVAALGYPTDMPLGATVALFLLAAGRERGVPWPASWTVMVLAVFVAYIAARGIAIGAVPVTELVHSALAWAVAWFAGERTRLRREQIEGLEDRAARAERDIERERELAAAEERARIARDLHDSAAHAINVIAVRAGAARLRHARNPERSLAALAEIEEVARQTADEIDQIVGELRTHAGGAVEPPIGMASLDGLVAHHRAAGLRVALSSVGPHRQLAPSVDQAAYRVLQEALTNAARHGTGEADVLLVYGRDAIELTVTNPLPTAVVAADRTGHGIIGMHERVSLLGGSLDADGRGGTFRVSARLPYRRSGS